MDEKKQRTHFSREVKENAVKLVIDGGRRCSDVAAEQHLPASSLYAWVKQARRLSTYDGSSEPTLAGLQRDNARLRKELKIAKEHALFLRRTATFFASEKK